jgi:hypothetical protein
MDFFKGLLMLTLLTASVAGQIEHAPTVAQCQADQRLWLSNLKGAQDTLPIWGVLSQWEQEMRDCEKVDTDNFRKYNNTQVEIRAEKMSRLLEFLDRHNLVEQFKQEDAMGQR